MYLSCLLFLTLPFLGATVDFTCPTGTITKGSGAFPKDASTLAQFPANYNCDVKFQIEDGFLVRLYITADISPSSGDSLIVQDSLGNRTRYFQGRTIYFAPANTATVMMSTSSETSQMWWSYEFLFMGSTKQNIYPTGTQLKLDLDNSHVYTFTSATDRVTLDVASEGNQPDNSLKNIYVYNGDDVTSPYIGNLFQLVNSKTRLVSKGDSLTLLNIYGTTTKSYAVANDYFSISTLQSYKFFVSSPQFPAPSLFPNLTGRNSITFLTLQSDYSYIEHIEIANGIVEISPLVPSSKLEKLLTYRSSDNLALYVPQQIPGNLFTLTVRNSSKLLINLSPSTSTSWKTPFNGRKGTIFSPSLWNPTQNGWFNETFESSNMYRFKFNVQSLIRTLDNEELVIRVGSPGSIPVDRIYKSNVENGGATVVNGTYMTSFFNSQAHTSSAIVNFEMEQLGNVITPTSTTSIPTTTSFASFSTFYSIFIIVVISFIR